MLRRPWYSPVRLVPAIAIGAALVYAVIGGLLYFTQDLQVYPATWSGARVDTPRALRLAAARGLVPWSKPTAGAASPQGFVARDFAGPAPRGTIVFFHGNGGPAWRRNTFVNAFRKRGFRTFLYEYPGYGGRPGRPRETTIVADARALVRELQAEGLGPIYLWGESLGAGVAASVAADPTLPVHGLVLMVPWDSLAGVAHDRFPWVPAGYFLHDTYDSIGNLARFGHPICVIRGDQDTTILPARSLNLFAHLPNPKLIMLEKGYGHGNWPSTPDLPWWDEALNFIAPAGK